MVRRCSPRRWRSRADAILSASHRGHRRAPRRWRRSSPPLPKLAETSRAERRRRRRGDPDHRHPRQDGQPRRCASARSEVTLAAIAKGSGMIAPQLATMIAVVTTDCAISPAAARPSAPQARWTTSFNCLTVDGDMSTNDAVFALANGLAGNPRIAEQGAAFDALHRRADRPLRRSSPGTSPPTARARPSSSRCWSTRRAQRRDRPRPRRARRRLAAGEGCHLRRRPELGPGAGHRRRARRHRRATRSTPPRRGPHPGHPGLRDGAPTPHDPPALRAKMREPEVRGRGARSPQGTARATAWGCDLSLRLREDQRRLHLADRRDRGGSVAKDDRLTNYSPAFKRHAARRGALVHLALLADSAASSSTAARRW